MDTKNGCECLEGIIYKEIKKMNNVSIMGRLTKDPTIKYITGDKPICVASFGLAVPDGKEKTYFINIKAFGKTAELVDKYLLKGDLVGIEGKIVTGSYESEGKKVYTFEVVANNLTLTPKATKDTKSEEVQEEIPTGFAQVDDEDIPF